MYKVLIADDHLDQRQLLRFLLEKRAEVWHIYEAKNGKEALEIMKNQTVDLLITDVQMPFTTGIELAEVIRESNPDVPILFISGYDNFSYAKKALELQAVNYLLKPINPEEFNNQLDLLIQIIKKKKIANKQIERVEQQDILIKLFKGLPFDKLDQYEQSIASPIISHTYYLMTLDVDNYEAGKLENYLHYHSIDNMTFIRTNLTRFLGLVHLKSINELIFQRRILQQYLKKELKIEVTIEISAPIENPSKIESVYKQLEDKITKSFYKKENIGKEKISLPTDNAVNENELFNQLKDSLQNHDFQNVKDTLNSLLTNFGQSASESPNIVKFFFANIYRLIMTETNIDSLNIQLGLQTILEATEFVQIAPALDDLMQLVEQRMEVLNKTTNDYVRETKNYIWNHYSEDLNLEILANNVHLAPKYLSDLFKREEKVGITKYLNEIRMERAKQLLVESHHRVGEISEMIGFNNYSYFIKSFQKYTGTTPDRFRKAKGKIAHEKEI